MTNQTGRYRGGFVYASRDPARDSDPIVAPAARESGPLVVRKLHQVIAGERLDHLAERYYGDPLKYHLICEANDAIFPEDLEVPGKVLKIPLDPT